MLQGCLIRGSGNPTCAPGVVVCREMAPSSIGHVHGTTGGVGGEGGEEAGEDQSGVCGPET